MIVHWEVEDGYVCKRRPQTTKIDDSEFEGMDEEQKQQYIEECVQNDFEQNIIFCITEVEE